MTAGIQIFDDDLFVQIDSNYRGLVRKETVTLSLINSQAGFFNPSIPGEPNNGSFQRWSWHDTTPARWTKYARAALRLTSTWTWHDFLVGQLFITGFPAPPGNATFSILAATSTPSGASAPVFDIYDVPDDVSSGYGLEIFDSNGDMVFDSNDEHMRVIKWQTGIAPRKPLTVGSPFWSGDPNTYTILPILPEIPASVSLTQDAYGWAGDDDQGVIGRAWFRQRTNNAIEVASAELYQLNNGNGYAFDANFSTLIIRT